MMKRTTIFLLLVFLALGLSAQKKVLLEDKDQIIERAKMELDSAMMAPEGYIYLQTVKNPIKGEYTFDISIWEKGTVTSLFAVGNNNGTLDAQNRLRAILMEFKFNFKMPKGKSYKFRHTFIFN